MAAPPPFQAAAPPACFRVAQLFPHDASAALLARLPTLPALNCLVAGPPHRCVAAAAASAAPATSAVCVHGSEPSHVCALTRRFARVCGRVARRSGKTTLLFNFAVNVAAGGGSAVFLCRRDRLEASPPQLAPGRAPDDALQRVDMRCARSAARRSARNVHTCSTAVTCVRPRGTCCARALRSRAAHAHLVSVFRARRCVRVCFCACAPHSDLADDRELRRWCASMHLLGTQPHAIVVDDLSQLVDARCVRACVHDTHAHNRCVVCR
jgi:hypothetical protein